MTDEPHAPDDLPAPKALRVLCRMDDLADGQSKGFEGPAGSFVGLFAVRQGDRVHVYVNACPHIGTPLDWVPGRFLSADRSRIICATHGAEFRIADGVCLRGPCRGDVLDRVPVEVDDGMIYVSTTAGT